MKAMRLPMSTCIIRKENSLYDVACPHCGKLIRNLYLEDSEGYFECDLCGTVHNVREEEKHLIERFLPLLEAISVTA